MRVLHICWSYPSERFPSEGSFFRNMIEPLKRDGVDVTVVTPLSFVPRVLGQLAPRFLRAATIPRQYEYNGVRVLAPRHIRLPHSLTGDLLPHLLVRAILSVMDQRPDIVHAHFAYPYGTAGLYLGRRWGVPVVITLHGSDGYAVPYRSEGDRRRFIQTVQGVDQVLAVSNELVQCVKDLAHRDAQFTPIGVDLDRFSKSVGDKTAARQRLNLPPTKKLLLFVGYLTTGKGVDLIPAVMERLPADVQLVAVGIGPLSHLVANNTRCIWIPAIPNSRVVEYMNAADLLVLPSRGEGTPTVVVEAGAACLPVVATAVGGIPDLLAGDRGILVISGSVESLVAGVQTALDDSVASTARAGRLFSFVDANYDCVKNGRSLAKLYTKLIAASSTISH